MISLEDWRMDTAVGIAGLIAYAFLAAVWLRFAVGRLPVGVARIVAMSPLIAVNCIIPFMFDSSYLEQSWAFGSAALHVATAFVIMWLQNCKMLAFSLNRGFLADIDTWSFWKFAAVLALPIMPKIKNKEDENLGAKLEEEVDPRAERCSKLTDVLKYLGQLYFKLGMLLLFAYIIARKDPSTPWREPLYSYGLMYLLGVGFDGAQLIALAIFDIETIDSFNHPYLAQDLTDLWGKRWNIMTAATLKPISYDIILEGRFVRPNIKEERKNRAEWVRAVATVFIFLLSGAFHIVFFWYAMHEWAWEWFLFFFIFGPLMIVERVIKTAMAPFFKKRKEDGAASLPGIISFPLRAIITNVFTLAIAGLLFCPPIHRSNIQYSAESFHYALLGRFISDR
ncbi:hypothetical protein BSKO_11148 [Bryopsis sp. KO-2023]|nr:hypothetical protein BSKO_11148 [Bryopsis sp. KO-2023]